MPPGTKIWGDGRAQAASGSRPVPGRGRAQQGQQAGTGQRPDRAAVGGHTSGRDSRRRVTTGLVTTRVLVTTRPGQQSGAVGDVCKSSTVGTCAKAARPRQEEPVAFSMTVRVPALSPADPKDVLCWSGRSCGKVVTTRDHTHVPERHSYLRLSPFGPKSRLRQVYNRSVS